MATYPTVRVPNPNRRDRRDQIASKVGVIKRRSASDRRKRVLERDQYTCQICEESYPNSYLECDHKVPLSQGGPDTDANCQCVCIKCHAEKSKTEGEGRKYA